jgi:hypothetical protein
MCSTGPKISSSRSSIPRTFSAAGATKQPDFGAATRLSSRPSPAALSTWASIFAFASASITGPTSVDSSHGSPTPSASMAPNSICMNSSATSS